MQTVNPEQNRSLDKAIQNAEKIKLIEQEKELEVQLARIESIKNEILLKQLSIADKENSIS